MHKIAGMAIALFLFATAANAQIPTKGNVFLGYSYFNSGLTGINRGSLNGWNGSLEGKVFPWIGIVGEFSGHYGWQDFPLAGIPEQPPALFHARVSEHNYLVGPRISFSTGRIRPFAHALFGAGHVNAGIDNTGTSFATALGGGFDYRLLRWIGWRVQADYLQTRFFSARQNNIRFSTGLVVRF